MEKTAKRIGIALLAVLLVALLCAGIALALPQAETPLASADGSSSLDTSVRSVTVGDDTYDLTDWQQANAYYQSLIGQGYEPITDQPSLQDFLNRNGGNSGAKGAMKPYSNTGSPITYTFGQHSTTDYGSNMGMDGVFKATLDGCGANVTLKVNHEWNSKHSKQSSGTDALTHAGITSDASYFKQVTDMSLTGTLANSASGATVKNLNMKISEAEQVMNGAKDNGVFVGGLFGAMYNTTIDNCSLNITAAITGTKTGTPGNESAGENTFAFGGIAAYALGSTISNFSLNLGAEINITTNGKPSSISSWGDGGNPRGAAGGAIAISQDVSMYNIVLTGSANVRSYIGNHWIAGNSHITRAGALVGISISPSNAEALTFGATSSSSGVTAINGVLTNYTGTAQWCSPSGSNWNEGSGQYVLIGSSEGSAITNLYWYGDTAPSASFAGNSSYTAIAVNATADKGTAQISFKNETGAVSSLSGLQVTYTAPADSGSILWSYTDTGAPGEGSDMYSTQPYETYTIQWERGLSSARKVTFTTGRKVRYYVRYDGRDITGEGGTDENNPVDTKTFDNTPYVHPVLQMWSPDGGTSLGEVNDNTYWSISKGETNSSWTTAVDVGTYNVRLIDAYKEDTAYDFIVEDQKLIAYKSDNSNYNGASRNYVFKITQRELTLDITEQPFVYDGEVQSLEFNLGKTVADDDPQPSVTAKYYNSAMTEIDVTQVVNAGDYFVTVTGVNDSNYYVNADDLEEYTNWPFSIAKRTITLMPSGYQDLVYNGAPQYPEAEVLGTDGLGGGVESIDIVAFNYYLKSNLDAPLERPDRKDAGEYRMTARLMNPENFVLDNSALASIPTATADETSVTIDYSIARDTLKFNGSADGYSFVYMAQTAKSLETLNQFIGGDATPTQYYFAPNNSENVTDVNVGAIDAQFTVTGDGTSLIDVGTYQVVISMPQSKNFEEAQTTITVEITKRQLVLNFTADPERVTSFQYGDVVPDYPRDNPQGAMAADQLKFGTVYYKGSISEENKLDVKPSDVGNYIASYEWIGTSSDYVSFEDIKGNYAIAEDANSTIAFTISKRDVTVKFANTDAVTYNGTEQNPVTITDIDGVIDSEVNKYTADKLKVQYILDGVASDTARNAGDYTLGAAATAEDDKGAFVNNYNITNAPTFTVNKAPLTLQLLDVAMDYVSATGQAIPYGEGLTHEFADGSVIFPGDDDQSSEEGWLLQIYALNSDGFNETIIDGIGSYCFSIRLNEANPNAGNYNLVVNDSTKGAQFENAPVGVGVLTVEGTPVFAGVYVYDESGEIVGSGFADAAAEGAYDITVSVVYGAQPYRAEFGTRTTAGSIEGISFDDPSSVTGGATPGKSDNGYPYISARNVGTYTAVFTLAADAQGKFYFPGEGKDSAYSIKVTFVIDELEVTVAPNAVEQIYGDEFKDAGYSVADDDGTIAAMLAADGFAPTYTSTTDASTAANTTGKVTLTQAFAAGSESNANNYVFTTEEGSVTVVPRPVTVSVTAAGSAVYGDGAPEITAIAAAEGSNTIIDGDADGLIAGLNADGVLDLANRNVGSTKIVIVEGKNEIGNYTVTLAEDTGVVQVTPKRIIVDVADGIVPYGATEADIRPANGVYFNGEPEFAYDDATKEFVFKIAGGGVDLTTQEPDTIPSVLQIAFVDETLNGNYDFEFTNGDLTVEAMMLEAGQVRVELEKDTYDGTVIDYDIFVGTVNVTDADPTRLIVTINGSRDTQIKDAGEYVFEINGDGDYYKGNVTVTVTVKQADISGMGFGLNKDSATYTGSVIDVKANTTIVVSLAVTQDGKEAQLINAGTYTVTVTPTDPNYTGSKEFTFTIDKAPHKAPVKDDLTIEVTWDSVTVTHDEFTVQLSKDGNDPWVDTTMDGYDANSSYTLHVRFKEDANHSASSNTIMISGKTAERTAVEFEITDVEEHYNRAVLTITFEEAFSGKVEYSLNGTDWDELTVQDGKYVVSGLAESAEYTLQVKIPAGDDYLESEVKSVKVKTGIDPAKYTETLAMFGETFSAGDLVNYETLKEQFNGLTEADKAGVDAAKFATITAARDAFVASVNSDIEDIQNVAAKTAGRAVAAAAAAVTAAAIALFIAKRKFI